MQSDSEVVNKDSQCSGTPVIDVVIPAHNAAATIADALASVHSQELAPHQIIVVDDGSTDGTAERVRQLAPDAKLLVQANAGAAAARQAGSDASTADYVAYLDADDWWVPDRLSSVVSLLRNESPAFVIGDLRRAPPAAGPEAMTERNSSFFSWFDAVIVGCELASEPGVYCLPPERALPQLLRSYPIYPSTLIVERAALQEIGGWDARFRRCQDLDLGLRFARKYPIYYRDRVEAILGLHEANSDVDAYVLRQSRGDLLVLETHWAEANDARYRTQVARALAGRWCARGYAFRRRGDRAAARASYRQALRWPGRRVHALLRLLRLGF